MDGGFGFDGGFQADNFGGGGGDNFNGGANNGGNNDSYSGSQFNAGGFVNGDNMNGSPTFSQSQSSPSSTKKRDAQSLTPVTIKQLQNVESKDSKYKLDGKDLAQVTFVGVILSVDKQQTNLNYMIDDGTGKMNVRIYIDLEDENQRSDPENSYVRVVGNLREFNGGLHVVGFQLLPIKDFNEITFHALEVISVHLRNTKGPPGGAAPVAQQASGSTGFSAAPAAAAGGGRAASGGGDLQQQVLKIFEADSTDTGASIDDVCRQFANTPKSEIRDAVEFLSDEGHLYSTVDEDHYKSTNA